MYRFKTLSVLISILVVWSAASLFADDFRDAVEKGAQAFMEAAQKGDSAIMGSLYADDAIAFPPNSEMVSGKEAIQAMWKTTLESGVAAIPLEVVSTESQHDLGIEVGKYTILGADKKELDRGKYVVVWK